MDRTPRGITTTKAIITTTPSRLSRLPPLARETSTPAAGPSPDMLDSPPQPPPQQLKSRLPTARVKRIISEDKDISGCSSEATFLITAATELFIETLAQTGYGFAKLDKRKTLQYKDLANATASFERLEFLADVIPRTMPFGLAVDRTENGTHPIRLE